MELGGILGAAATWYFTLPEAPRQTIGQLLSKDWGSVQLAALVPLALAIAGYLWSWVSTVVPHVVSGGQHIELQTLPSATKRNVEAAASVAKKK